jgi:hypothetical protein
MKLTLRSIITLAEQFRLTVQNEFYRYTCPNNSSLDCSELLHDLGGLLGEW